VLTYFAGCARKGKPGVYARITGELNVIDKGDYVLRIQKSFVLHIHSFIRFFLLL